MWLKSTTTAPARADGARGCDSHAGNAGEHFTCCRGALFPGGHEVRPYVQGSNLATMVLAPLSSNTVVASLPRALSDQPAKL